MKCAYKRQQVIDAYRSAASDLFRACDCACGDYLISVGFGGTRLKRFFEEYGVKLNGMVDSFGDGKEDAYSTITTVSYVARERLLSMGVDTARIDADHLPIDGWTSSLSTAAQHKCRMELVDKMRYSTDAYLLCACDYFRERYGYGKDRLTEMYTRIRQYFNRYVRNYTRCDLQGDTECHRMLTDSAEQLKAKGIDLDKIQ